MQGVKDEINKRPEKTQVTWDGTKYTLLTGQTIEKIIPFPAAGKLFHNGEEIHSEHIVQPGDAYEFIPEGTLQGLIWELQVCPEGSKATVKVKRQPVGRFKLQEDIPEVQILNLEELITWQDVPEQEEEPSKETFYKQLAEKGIVHGILPDIWGKILAVENAADIVVAESTPPVQTQHAQLIDYVGKPLEDNQQKDGKIDYFACKLRVCRKDEVLAKKIPGKEGIPGKNVFGQPLPVEQLKDFSFKLKKNIYISEDGLELRAACDGIPVRLGTYDYLVENVYIAKDIDLSTGSIDFPGDVLVVGDVHDGLRVYSGGKIQIGGSVSGAELKAEAGLQVIKNVIASKITIGEKHVFRSRLYQDMQGIYEELELCLAQVERLKQASSQTPVGPLLKVVLEKNFPNLPKMVEDIAKLMNTKDPEIISDELKVAVETLKHFLVGAGPLNLKDLIYLKNALKVIEHFLAITENLIPQNVLCDTSYIQNSELNCAGDFNCSKGVYNSNIRVQGNTKVAGVFRGGELYCGGNIYIRELGGSAISPTTVKTDKDSKIKIDYCHANVIFHIGKQLLRIDESVQQLEIYREKGVLKMEKLKWNASSQLV
ncbi:MAG: DUF342 domain-containing protein [Peptococcaceae bacterium]|nr:DUF342 domain-containing protein [Peptococcaceae bacterium]